ncbi:MAG: hypothetical protein WDO69_34720 [Pseudomonadota bacterium]
MNLDDDDDSVFEQALRADLPSTSEQNRLRQRILAAGIAAGTALGSTNVAAAQASLGANALSKLSALSWPAKLGLTAVLALPLAGAALPLAYTPVRAAAIVNQVRKRAAAVHAQSANVAIARANLLPPATPRAMQAAQPMPEPGPAQVMNSAVRSPVALAGNQPAPALSVAIPSAPANSSAGPTAPAVAAFATIAREAPVSSSAQSQNATTLAAETHLLDRAFAALAAGDRSTAAALVAEHARRFPNGLLSQERERARARLERDPKGE